MPEPAAPPVAEHDRQMQFTLPRFTEGREEVVPHRSGDNLTEAGKAAMPDHGMDPLKTSAMRQAGMEPLEITLRYGTPSASLQGAAKAPKRVIAVVKNPPFSVHEVQLEDHDGTPRLKIMAEIGLTEAYWAFKKKKEGFRVPTGTPISELNLDPMQEELLDRNGFRTLDAIRACDPDVLAELVGTSDAYYLQEAAKQLLDATPAPAPDAQGAPASVDVQGLLAEMTELREEVARLKAGAAGTQAPPEAAAAQPSLEDLAQKPTEGAPKRRSSGRKSPPKT